MPAYHVVPRNKILSSTSHLPEAVFVTHDSYAARKHADDLHQQSGEHYHVVKVETVWATTTLDELMGERA